jgi:nucleoside-diphosphate-sugar epimerase
MAKETVVLTGATHFIGASVLQLLLQRNYNVRVVVRNLIEQKTLLSNANLKGIETQHSPVPNMSYTSHHR